VRHAGAYGRESCGSAEVDLEAEVGELADEPPGGLLPIGWVEVRQSEAVVLGAAGEHVVDRGENRGDAGDDGRAGAPAGLEAPGPGVKVAVKAALLGPGGAPSGPEQGGLEPGDVL
jgi:hypothetical protein